MEHDGELFVYRAKGHDGDIVSGSLTAKDQQAAITAVVARGLTPIRIEKGAIKNSFFEREISLFSSKHLKHEHCEMFCRELHLLLVSGLTVSEALGILVETQAPRSRIGRFVRTVHKGIRAGRPLSEAVSGSGYELPSDFVPVLRAGETSGSLAVSLEMLSESYRSATNFARSFAGALVYPAFLLLVAVVALGIISFLVAPTLADLFTSMDKPVPIAIALLSDMAAAMKSNLGGVVVFLGLTLVVLAWAARRQTIKSTLREMAFRLPLIGSLLVWGATNRFASTLKLYVQSSVPLAKALPGACSASGFPNSNNLAGRLETSLRKGGRTGEALQMLPLLPKSTVHLLNIGETGGRLPEALNAVVAESRHRFESRAAAISSMLAPVLIVVVGGAVGSLVFVVFSALLEVNNIASM